MISLKCITYRLAKKADLEAVFLMSKKLLDLHKKYGWYYTFKKDYLYVLKKTVAACISSKQSFVLIAELDGNIIGYCLVRIADKPAEPEQLYVWKKEAELLELFVEPKFRNNGIGTELFERAIGLSKKRKTDVIRVIADIRNKGADKFYKREGMDLYDEVLVMRLK